MSNLFWYKILFMTELIAAEVLFTTKLRRRRHFVPRLLGSLAVLYIVAIFYPVGINTADSWWYSSLMFFVMFAFGCGALAFVYKISFSSALFFALTAYTLQHICHELFTLIVTVTDLDSGIDMYSTSVLDFSNFSKGTLAFILIYVDIYIFGYGAARLSVGKIFNHENIKLKNVTLLWFGAFILLIDVVLSSMVIYSEDSSLKFKVITGVYNIVCCILVFYIQVNLVSVMDMRVETAQMKEMLRQSQRQYMLQKETINLINTKCHDLRHRMSNLAEHGTMGNEELQGKVTAYETQVAELQDKLKQTQLDSAIKVALLGAKANDLEYMTFKLKEKGELELAEDGSIKGIDDKIAGLKTQYPNQFEKEGGGKIDPQPLPGGDDHKTEPQSLAEALRMQYEGDN